MLKKYDLLIFTDDVKINKFFSITDYRFQYMILYKAKKDVLYLIY